MENFFRIIAYVILLVINGFVFYFLHSHFHFLLLVIMIAGPVLSALLALYLRSKIRVVVENRTVKDKYAYQNKEGYVYIKIINPTWAMSLDVKLCLAIRNTFFETEGERIISIPVYAKKGYELELPIVATLPGIIQVEVKTVKIKDLMGFMFLKKDINEVGEITVMPEKIGELDFESANLDQGMLESEESSKRGNDFSDVHEIREYIPGDKLMSIHWKLSAKRDILMVKDRVSMSDKQLVILPELCGIVPHNLEIILTTTYSIISQLIQDKTTVRLMYWSATRFEYEDIRIDYAEELDDAFAKMFYEKTYMDMNEAASHMANVHPEMRAYLHVTADGSKAVVMVKENG